MRRSNKLKYILVAGTNGAGKSTLYQAYPELFKDTIRINADEELKKFGGDWRSTADNFQAMRTLIKLMDKAFKSRSAFHQETTLSGSVVGHQNRIKKAKSLGYHITLLYVGLDSSEIAVQRVAARVSKGGHGIPIELIKKRYNQSLKI
ncbi:zeta toxin family protein [Enterococcus sp. LJL120]